MDWDELDAKNDMYLIAFIIIVNAKKNQSKRQFNPVGLGSSLVKRNWGSF